jgi:hypothetical protein
MATPRTVGRHPSQRVRPAFFIFLIEDGIELTAPKVACESKLISR